MVVLILTAEDMINEQLANFLSFVFSGVYFLTFYFLVVHWKKNPQEIHQNDVVRRNLWIMFFFAAASLFLIFSISWKVYWIFMALAVSVGLASSILSLTSAFYFLVLLVLFRPWEISDADPLLKALPRAGALMVLVLLILKWIKEKGIRIAWNREIALLFLFSLWLFLSTFSSSDPVAAKAYFWDTYFRSLILFFLMVNLIDSKFKVEIFKIVLIGSLFGVGLLASYYNIINDVIVSKTGRLDYLGLLGDPNDITAVSLIGLPFCLKAFYEKDRKIYRMLFSGCYITLMGYLLILAQSRGAILGLLSMGIFYIFLYTRNWGRTFLVGCLLGVLYFPAQSLLKREAGDLESSGKSRVIYWQTAVNMAVRNPIFGVGLNDYPNKYEDYLMVDEVIETGKRTAHSSWFLVIAEAGIPGFVFFISLFLLTLKRSLLIYKEYPEYFVSLASYMVTMSFLSHSYLIFPYLLLGLVLVASINLTNRKVA